MKEGEIIEEEVRRGEEYIANNKQVDGKQLNDIFIESSKTITSYLSQIQSTLNSQLVELKNEFFSGKMFPEMSISWTLQHSHLLLQFEKIFQSLEETLRSVYLIEKKLVEFQTSNHISSLEITNEIETKIRAIRKDLKCKFIDFFQVQLEKVFLWPKAKHKISVFPFDDKNTNFKEIEEKFASKEFENSLFSQLMSKMKEENNKMMTQHYFEALFQFFIIYSLRFQILFAKFQRIFNRNDYNNNNNNNNNEGKNDLIEKRVKRDRYLKLWILSSLITPIDHRFQYYFNQSNIRRVSQHGAKKMENIDTENEQKFEFFSSFILNKINDHSEYLLLFIQPAITFTSSNLTAHYNIKIEFIKNLILTLNRKLHAIYPSIARRKQTLFCSSISTLLQFHQSLLLYHSYPPSSHPFSAKNPNSGLGFDISIDNMGLGLEGELEVGFCLPFFPLSFDVFNSNFLPKFPHFSVDDVNNFLFDAFLRIHAAVLEEKIDEIAEDESALSNFYTPEYFLDVDEHQPTLSSHFLTSLFISLYQQSKLITNDANRSQFHHNVIFYLLDLYYHFIKEKKIEIEKSLGKLEKKSAGDQNDQTICELLQSLCKLCNSLHFCLIFFGDFAKFLDHFVNKYQNLLLKIQTLLITSFISIIKFESKPYFHHPEKLGKGKKGILSENLESCYFRVKKIFYLILHHLGNDLKFLFLEKFLVAFDDLISDIISFGYLQMEKNDPIREQVYFDFNSFFKLFSAYPLPSPPKFSLPTHFPKCLSLISKA